MVREGPRTLVRHHVTTQLATLSVECTFASSNNTGLVKTPGASVNLQPERWYSEVMDDRVMSSALRHSLDSVSGLTW